LKGIGRKNHGRPWACEREGPVPKKMLWKVGVYSCLSERLIRDGRDSAKRVVFPSIPFKFPHENFGISTVIKYICEPLNRRPDLIDKSILLI
jgi:hypothetical protein